MTAADGAGPLRREGWRGVHGEDASAMDRAHDDPAWSVGGVGVDRGSVQLTSTRSKKRAKRCRMGGGGLMDADAIRYDFALDFGAERLCVGNRGEGFGVWRGPLEPQR